MSAPHAVPKPLSYVWRWRKHLGERHGTRCRVLAYGRLNAALIQFESDGYRVLTSRYAIRAVHP